jgi:hypothetical protein
MKLKFYHISLLWIGIVFISVADPGPALDPPDPHFLSLLDPDPDPLERGMDPDPDPSIIKRK